jgi:hypothetical protein
MNMNKSIGIGVVVGLLGVAGLGGYLMYQPFELTPSGSLQGMGNTAPGSAASASVGSTAAPGSAANLRPSQPEFLTQRNGPNGLGNSPLNGEAFGGAAGLSSVPAIAGTTGMTGTVARAGAAGTAGAAGLGGLAGSSPALPNFPIGKPGTPSIEGIQQRLQALVANGRQPTAKEVDAVLADLQLNQGGNMVGGVNLQALRENLARTDRIGQIAQEIQAIASQPSKADLPRLKSLTDEMQRLQGAITSPTGPALGNQAAVR